MVLFAAAAPASDGRLGLPAWLDQVGSRRGCRNRRSGHQPNRRTPPTRNPARPTPAPAGPCARPTPPGEVGSRWGSRTTVSATDLLVVVFVVLGGAGVGSSLPCPCAIPLRQRPP